MYVVHDTIACGHVWQQAAGSLQALVHSNREFWKVQHNHAPASKPAKVAVGQSALCAAMNQVLRSTYMLCTAGLYHYGELKAPYDTPLAWRPFVGDTGWCPVTGALAVVAPAKTCA
eukprot:TRINITY_DN1502_c0_g1_i3.p1 TRINITY_DN1502_c0_g1~~TRINITY_DN1502_c0_g1_i3.p1  ORF type:complete len:116 (-),score=11.16 TRINITY_DN1502_c0_g1_i3:1972-2319(-)